MRKCKRLLACAAAFAMSCTMVTGWANTATIESVEIVDGETRTTVAENGKIAPSDYVEVTVLVKNEAEVPAAVAAAQATFLSYLAEVDTEGSEKVLDNTTIQYVDQGTTGEDGKVVFGFRPRFTTGDYIAKAGGDDVAAPDSFNYSVEKPKTPLVLTAVDNQIKVGEDATFTVEGLVEGDALTVKVGDAPLEAAQFTYASGTLTIKAAVFTEWNKTYNVTISADETKYIAAAGTVVTEKEPAAEIPEGDIPDVEEDIKEIVPEETEDGKGVEFAPTVTVPSTGATVDVTYTVAGADAEKVNVTGSTITLKDDVFAAKVTVTATVGTIASQKVVYIIPNPDAVEFGNLELVAKDGADAFASDTNFDAVKGSEEFTAAALATKVEAMNFVLGRKGETDKPDHFKAALDYDHDGKISLAEYRIIKLMYDGENANFKPNSIKAERANWLLANPPAAN